MEKTNTNKWFHNISKTPKEAEEEYDKICFDYDKTMESKDYQSPKDAAKILADYVSQKDTAVLDAGCGTGMIGLAIYAKGFSNLTGFDISSNSLKVAEKKNVYKKTLQQNILEKLSFQDNEFGALVCIGVFSRFEDAVILKIVKEFERVVAPNGIIILSHREDLVKNSTIIDDIKKMPRLTLEQVTDAYAYIPIDEAYKGIGVHYIILRKKEDF